MFGICGLILRLEDPFLDGNWNKYLFKNAITFIL